MTRTTEQEAFWAGEFGNEYVRRNRGAKAVAASTIHFGKILSRTQQVRSVLELGANIGLNMMALRHLLPNATLTAVEINELAAAELKANVPSVDVRATSIFDFQPESNWDLVFTKGVLIHLNPDKLPDVYDLMYQASSRYLMVSEYYNPSPVEISYRGHTGKLFKRDFAGEIMDRYPDLKLIDYGFAYHRDPQFLQDDLTWFLMEKR